MSLTKTLTTTTVTITTIVGAATANGQTATMAAVGTAHVVTATGAIESSDPGVFATKVGKELFTYGVKVYKSWSSEHQRFYPDPNDKRVIRIPLQDLGGSRISYNFNHRSWVPRGSRDRLVRITFHQISDDLRDAMRLQMKADKQGRTDRDRGQGQVWHGRTFTLGYGTSGDRAYYFAERGSVEGAMIPKGAYIKLELLD
jgi:hypothetical protein